MLKSGVFITPNNSYTVYEIEESGFYRIDILRGQGSFQVDLGAVVYSQVRRKGVYTFGDSEIYDEYLRVKETITSAKFKTKKESHWDNGVYISKQHSENTKLGFMMETTTNNGVVTDTILLGNGYTIQSFVVDPIYGVKLEPLNFRDYTSVQLSKDTISGTERGLFYSLDVLKRRFDLDHIESKDYVVATDLETARKRLREFDENDYPFKGIDTETSGTEVHKYGDDVLVGVILGADPNTATYFPFRHKDDFNLPISFLKEIMDVVNNHEEKLVAHNKKFDRQVFLKEGYDLRIKWDTMQLSIVLNPVIGRGIHGEKHLTYELTGKHFLELDEIFVNSKDIDFSVLPVDIIKYYACPDGTNVLLLLEDMLKRLPKFQYRLAMLECDLADVKADQEYYGIRVDVKKFEKQYQNCNYIIETLLKAFRTLTREDGNINSAQVLTNLIYNKMHCKVLLRTKTGQASTSMIAIKKLAKLQAKTPHNITEDIVDLQGNVVIKASELAKSKYPALVILAKYKEYNKLKTAFYSRFERTMKTGRIFFWVNQNGAATGRQSSPMHQLPPELKDVILSDDDDRDFWGPDFSQIELRMIAYLAGESELIELAKDPDNDIHRIIGSLISGKEMWAITPEERSKGKRRNFGVVYLISARGLAGQIVGPGYTKEDVNFCQQQLDDFYRKFKRVDRYIKRNAALVQKRGYMETEWFHRRRLFLEIFDPDLEPSRRASILRMGNNVPVQGTAADYLKLAEVQMFNYIKLKGWDKLKNGFPLVRMMLSIHDEIIISADNSIPYEEIIEMITKCMETPVDDAPPFFVQPARMDNWGGHSDDACAMPIRYRDKVIEDYNRTGVSVFKQSYFDLVIPEAVVSDLNHSSETTEELICKYINQVTLKFNHGNYTQEFSTEHVKDAFKNFINSGIKTYRIDNYIENLDNFRQQQLQNYMSELISEYGTDYKIVGQHVRHPSLTHTLLDKYSKQIPRDMEHVDRIVEATRLYIDDVTSGKFNTKITFTVDLSSNKPKATDKDKFNEQLEQLVQITPDGEVLYEDESEEMDDAYNNFYDEDPDDVIDRCNNKPNYVWELGDVITFDVQDLKIDDVNKVLSYIFKRQRPDGFYKVMLIYNGKMVDTKMRIEELDIDAANEVVMSLLPKEVNYA